MLPLSLGAFVEFLIIITDNYFLSQVSADALNGAGTSAMMYITATMVGMGLSNGSQILMARRFGAGDKIGVGYLFANGVILMLITATTMYVVLELITHFWLPSWLRSESLLVVMQEFLDIRVYGLFFYLTTMMFMAFHTGIAQTRILFATALLTAGINIFLDYMLIFGNFGFDRMEHIGAANATLIAEICGCAFLVLYTFFAGFGKEYVLLKALKELPLKKSKSILKISAPIMLQQVLALATWTLFFFMVEKTGAIALKISHLIRSMYMLAFVSIMGIGQTTKTFVSAFISGQRQKEFPVVFRRLIFMSVAGVFILCHGMIIYPHIIAAHFFEDSADQLLFVQTMRVVFFSMLLFSSIIVWLNAIQGAGKTLLALGIEVLAIVVYLGLVYHYTNVNPVPVNYLWMTDYVYFGIMGLLSGLYLLFGKWRYYRI
jgi:putative MATE family efflux protein